MEYKPGGYSWLGVAREPKKEIEIEKLEDQIQDLKKKYHKSHDTKLLTQMKSKEEKISRLRNKS